MHTHISIHQTVNTPSLLGLLIHKHRLTYITTHTRTPKNTHTDRHNTLTYWHKCSTQTPHPITAISQEHISDTTHISPPIHHNTDTHLSYTYMDHSITHKNPAYPHTITQQCTNTQHNKHPTHTTGYHLLNIIERPPHKQHKNVKTNKNIKYMILKCVNKVNKTR